MTEPGGEIIRHPSAPPERPQPLQEAPEPGARWPGESDKAYQAFTVYRDLPPGARSLAAAGQLLDKTRTWLGEWSAKWSWVERASAWDAAQDRIRRLALQAEAEEAAKRHAQQARLLMQVQMWPAQRFAELMRDPEQMALLRRRFDMLAPDEMAEVIAKTARSFAALAQLERVSRGLPDQRLELTGAGGGPMMSVNMMTDADRAAEVLDILQAAGAIGGGRSTAEPAADAEADDIQPSRANP